MYNFDTVKQLKDELKENFDALSYQIPTWPELEADIQVGETYYINVLIKRIQAAFVASLPEGIEYVPKLNLFIKCASDEGSAAITAVHLTVRSALNAAFEYRCKNEFVANNTLEDAVKVFFLGVFYDLIDRAAQYSNVIAINEELKSITDDAETKYSVSLTLSASGKTIEYIDDTSVVFHVDRDKVLDPAMGDILFKSGLDDLGLSGDELALYTKALDKVHDNNVAEFRTLATTPEFVAAKPKIILSFVKLEYFQPDTLIRKSLHRTVAVLKNSKKDERFRVEGDGYMGIGQRVDGQLGVSLHPFDTKTYKPVDVDILKGLED